MATFTMYRCDACGVTSDKEDAYQRVQFPTGSLYDHCPEWLVCSEGSCFEAIWARRTEVTKQTRVNYTPSWYSGLIRAVIDDPVGDDDAEAAS